MNLDQQPIEYREQTVSAGGVSFNCREAGDGLPVVFLATHSWGHDGLYRALVANFRLFILDLGAGAGDASITVEGGIEAAIREAARALAGDAYNLVGVSRGANLALSTVLNAPMAPEPVESLVLISPTAVLPAPDMATITANQWRARLLAHPESAPNLEDVSTREDYLATFGAADADSGLEGSLANVNCPTLAVFGTKDGLVAREAPSTYRAAIPNCHVSLVYDAGHLAPLERPEAVSKAVVDFIENRETFVVNRQRSVINP